MLSSCCLKSGHQHSEEADAMEEQTCGLSLDGRGRPEGPEVMAVNSVSSAHRPRSTFLRFPGLGMVL